MTNLQNLDMNVYKQIAERMKAEREQIVKKSQQILTPSQTTITPQTTTPAVEDKKDYVYVPALKLYISEGRYLQYQNWDQVQETLHREGKRMPTIPEFVEFLKYLRSDQGKLKVPNANNILDEIYKPEGNWRAEWLDAKFEDRGNGMYVSYHIFEDNGRIVQKQEKLEDYLTEAKDEIALDFWLGNSTKQGLPKNMYQYGNLYYLPPKNGRVAGFSVGFSRKICFSSNRLRNITDSTLGVRYVRKAE